MTNVSISETIHLLGINVVRWGSIETHLSKDHGRKPGDVLASHCIPMLTNIDLFIWTTPVHSSHFATYSPTRSDRKSQPGYDGTGNGHRGHSHRNDCGAGRGGDRHPRTRHWVFPHQLICVHSSTSHIRSTRWLLHGRCSPMRYSSKPRWPRYATRTAWSSLASFRRSSRAPRRTKVLASWKRLGLRFPISRRAIGSWQVCPKIRVARASTVEGRMIRVHIVNTWKATLVYLWTGRLQSMWSPTAGPRATSRTT